MIPRISFSRRRTWIGFAIIAALTVATIPRANSQARPANSPPARKALRERIIALHDEVELLAVEHEAEREILKQKLFRVPLARQTLLELRYQIRFATAIDMDALDEGSINGPVTTARERSSDATADALLKGLLEAKKTGDMEGVKKAMTTWLETAKTGTKQKIDEELDPLRKEFSRHASELAGKRLDLEDAESRYREAR